MGPFKLDVPCPACGETIEVEVPAEIGTAVPTADRTRVEFDLTLGPAKFDHTCPKAQVPT